MKVYGQLERGQVENVGALPAAGVKGRILFLTTDSKFYFDDGTAYREIYSPTSTVPITSGGTGQSTATAAFDALAPTTTAGDVIVHNGTDNVRQAIGSDGQVLVVDTAQTNKLKWTTLQQGAKNYITYNNFENNAITGWNEISATYSSNTPSGTPTISSSAAANLTIAATSTNPLAGTYSMQAVLTAPSAGVGFCTDSLTIDREDRAKVMQGSFYYEVVSGSGNFSGTSSNTFSVWILDGTSTWIQPAGVYNMVQSSGQGFCSFTFQTNSDTSTLRVVVLVNASATITVNFDDFYLGPQKVVYGAPIEDWKSFSPSWTNLTVGNGTQTAYKCRIGDTEYIKIGLIFGSTTSISGTVSLTLPNTIDTAKYPRDTSNYEHKATFEDSSANQSFDGRVSFTSSTVARPIVDTVSGTRVDGTVVNATGPFTWATGDELYLNFYYPVVGWSSNTVMSNDTDTRVVAFSAQAATTVIAASSVDTTVINPTKVYDTHGAYNTSTGVYTVPVSGKYRFSAGVQGASLAYNSTANLSLSIVKNGSGGRTIHTDVVDANVTKRMYLFGSATLDLVAGDTVSLICAQNNAGTSTLTGSTTTNYFEGERISGPATIAASEFVCAKATGVPTGTIAGSVASCTTAIFGTEEFDTHGAYNPSTGEFTVPVAGYYRVTSFVSVSSTEVVDTYVLIVFRKNSGSVQYNATRITATGLTSVYATGSNIIKCVAGDVLTIRVSSGSTSPVFEVGETGQYIIFEKVG
jgi:hypothetical protein